ncbi:hypothetical protein GVAV_002819 [Gurleya vavrai]
MSNDSESQRLLQDLIDAGFDHNQAEIAIKQVHDKNFDSCVEYIESLQRAVDERSRRKQIFELEEMKRKRDDEERQEDVKRKAIQDIKDKEYLENLKAKIEADKREREVKDSMSSSNDVMKTTKVTETCGKDDCKIRVRFSEGQNKIFTFNKDRKVTDLLEVIKGHYNGKSFEMMDTYFVEIKVEDKSFEEMGFFPTKVVIAKRK